MTRKRFIKLLMSKGIQRNAAQEIAARYNSRNIPYAKAYNAFLISESAKRCFETMSGIFETMSGIFEKIKAAIQPIKDAFCDLAENIRDYQESLLEAIKYICHDRDPLPQPQKYLCMKTFVIDRRKAINRIKKKKGTVYPCFFCDIFILIKQNVCKVSQNVVL